MIRRAACLAICVGAIVAWRSAVAAPPDPQKKGAPSKTYKACPRDKVWSESQGGCVCAPGSSWDDATRKCASEVSPPAPRDAARAKPEPRVEPSSQRCPPAKRWSDAHGLCVVLCPPGKIVDAKGTACVHAARSCRAGERWSDASARCVAICPEGSSLDDRGLCVEDEEGESAEGAQQRAPVCPAGTKWHEARRVCAPACPAGTTLDEQGTACVPVGKSCPPGREYKRAFGGCVPICGPDQILDFYGAACHPLRPARPRR